LHDDLQATERNNANSVAIFSAADYAPDILRENAIYGSITDWWMRLWCDSLRMFGRARLQRELLLPRLPTFERHGDGFDVRAVQALRLHVSPASR
jgi:hypothetical protein